MRTEKHIQTHIRWCIRRDMPEVLEIESRSFQQSWEEEDFLQVLRQRNCIAMVADIADRVVGYIVYELHKTRLHILKLAVHPSFRRCSVGAKMLAKLESKLSSHRRTRITLEVRETNLVAQLFFQAQGFRAINVKHGFFADTGEDAYLMSRTLETLEPPF